MILSTHNLYVGYKNKAVLKDLNLSLKKGELVGLIGPNGAGKSTLFKTLSGLIPSVKGEIFIDQSNLEKLQPQALAKKLGLVLANRSPTINFTVREMIGLGRTPHTNWLGKLSKKDQSAVASAIKETKLESLADRSIVELSDGEKQRVMIAKALAQETPIIFLDEPTAHLDINSRVELISLLKTLTRKINKAILFSTHELDLAIQMAGKIWLITPDNTITAGTPEDLILQGKMKAAFGGETSSFDDLSGSFKILHESNRTISLSGEGIARIWTEKALRKIGFNVVEGGDTQIKVGLGESGGYFWLLRLGDRELKVGSIEKLMEKIESFK